MKKQKVAVLVSGRGSNLQALIDACIHPNFPAEIVLVLSNQENAKALERARDAGIETCVIHHHDFESRQHFDQAMDVALCEHEVELVCMAGFMRLLSPWFVEQWYGKLINIHPSLLPDFKGLNAQQQALDAGVERAGCTVHYVSKEMDAGPIILQGVVSVEQDDTVESLSARILQEEHIIYVEALRLVATGAVVLENHQIVRL